MIKRSLHIILAISILLSSTGLVISKHFCQSELIDISILGKATSCSGETCQELPNSTEDEVIRRKNCCKDVSNHLKIEIEQEVDIQFSFVDYVSSKGFPILKTSPERFIGEVRQLDIFKYKPPLLVYNIPVNLQVFLC